MTPIPDKNYFRVSEAARLIGESRSNIYHWIKVGTIRAVRIGNKIKIERGEILRLLKSN